MQDMTLAGTRKLYYEDAYQKTFDAEVISCEAAGSGRYLVVLDQTAFFPEEGGQSADTGVLSGFRVADVQIKDGIITHVVEAPDGSQAEGAGAADNALVPGRTVTGQIDWPHRFSNMQHHSGEHLFSGIACRRFGCENVGFHLSESEVTLDLNKPLTADEIAGVEASVNAAIQSNIETQILYPTKEEESLLDYRSKLEISGQVRVVEFPGVDLCACCAPHVARTGEIGLLKVMNVQNYKGGVRVSILCADRALEALGHEHELITEMGRALSTSIDELPAQIGRFKDEIARLKEALKASEGEKLELLASAVPADEPDVILFTAAADAKSSRDLINRLVGERSGICAVFTGSDEAGYSFIIGSGSGRASEAADALKKAFNARGGGKPQMTQGSVAAGREEIRRVLREL